MERVSPRAEAVEHREGRLGGRVNETDQPREESRAIRGLDVNRAERRRRVLLEGAERKLLQIDCFAEMYDQLSWRRIESRVGGWDHANDGRWRIVGLSREVEHVRSTTRAGGSAVR